MAACPNIKSKEWQTSVKLLEEDGAWKSWLKNDNEIIDHKVALYQVFLEENFDDAIDLLDQYINIDTRYGFTNDEPSKTIIENADTRIFSDPIFVNYIGEEKAKILGLDKPSIRSEYVETFPIEERKGRLDINRDQILKLLGHSMYNKPIAQVALKELLQNSFDGIKTKQKLSGKNKTGRIRITINRKDRTISVRDDGIGMTPETLQSAFLTVGGTNKQDLDISERSGGFGLAKVQFLLGSEEIYVETIREGIKTTVDTTNSDLYNDNFKIKTETTTQPNGTYVRIKIPETYTTLEGVKKDISFPGNWRGWSDYTILNKPLIGNVDVKVRVIEEYGKEKVDTIPIGVNSDKKTLPRLFTKIKFDWGEADLYMSENKVEGYPNHYILSSGIYQFDHDFVDDDYDNVPYNIVVNIKSSVRAESDQYPFNNQREGFKGTVQKDISALKEYIAAYTRGESDKESRDTFSDLKSLPKIDPNKILTDEERNAIYDNYRKILEEVGKKQKDREKLREEELDDFATTLIRIVKGKTKIVDSKGNEKEFESSFKAEKEIDRTTPKVEETFFDDTYSQFHNNTNVDYLKIPGAIEFFSEIGAVILDFVRFAGNQLPTRSYSLDEFKKLKGSSETDKYGRKKFFAGVSIDKSYGGVHIRKILDAIFINPLASPTFKTSEGYTYWILGVIIHELNHTTVSGEGARFTGALETLRGHLHDTGKMPIYENMISKVISKHFKTYNNLRDEYNKSNTKNISKSINAEQIKGSTTGDIPSNERHVPTRQLFQEGSEGDRQSVEEDQTGEIIASAVNKLSEEDFSSKGLTQTDTIIDVVENKDPEMAIIKMDVPAQEHLRAKEILYKVANQLSFGLGIPYTVTTANAAVDMLQNTPYPYDGENAFFFDGKVFLVGDNVSLDDVLHEFAHPLVRAIGVQNPALFNKIYQDLTNTKEGQEIINNVKDKYDENFKYFKEEVIVRALAEKSTIDTKEQVAPSTFQKIINKIIFALKQLFRNVFGKVRIDKLSETTTLNELAEMLTSETFEIDVEIVTDKDVAAYAEKMNKFSNSLENLKNSELINVTNNIYSLILRQLSEVEENKNYDAMRDILGSRKDVTGRRGKLVGIQESLRHFQTVEKFSNEDVEVEMNKLREDVEYVKRHSVALLTNMEQANQMLKMIDDHLKEIGKDPDNTDNLQKAFYYMKIIDFWKEFDSSTKDIMEKIEDEGNSLDENSQFYKLIDSISRNVGNAERKIKKLYLLGLRDVFLDELKPMMKNIKARYDKLVKAAEKRPEGKTKDDYLKKLKNDFDAAYMTPEKVMQTMKGQLGDANWANGFFEGYMYSGDPIVAGLAKYVKDALSDVIVKTQKQMNAFLTDMENDIKESNVNMNPRDMGEKTTFVDTVLQQVENEEGELTWEEKEIYTILNPFIGNRKAYKEHQNALDEANDHAIETGDRTKLVDASNKFRKFLRDYYWRPYSQVYYDRQKVFDTPAGQKAWTARQEVFEALSNLDRGEENEIIKLENLDEKKALLRRLRQLSSLTDLNGNKKISGAKDPENDLDVALVLKEYSKESRKFFEYTEAPNLWQQKYDEVQTQLRMRGLNDTEINEKLAEWVTNNTRIKIKDEFYTQRANISARIQKIIETLPTHVQEKLNLSSIYDEIFDSIIPYRDVNGQPIGADMTDKLIKRIKTLQEELITTREEVAKFTGLTIEEQDDFDYLAKKLKNETLTQLELDKYHGLREKMKLEGLNKYQRQILFSLFAEFKDLQHKEPTEYYLDIMNNYLSKVDTSLFVTRMKSNELTKTNLAAFLDDRVLLKNIFSQSKEFQDWFAKNHIDRKIYNRGTYSYDRKYDIVYAWTVTRPNDDQYYETTVVRDEEGKQVGDPILGVPTFEYYDRNVKDSYVDEETGKTVMLKTPRIAGETIDNSGRWLPKQGKDLAPGVPDVFRNEEYFRLKREDPARFRLIEKLTKWMLSFQKDAENSSKLYLDVPRFPMSNLEYLKAKGTGKKAYSKAKTIWQGVKDFFIETEYDYEEGLNFDETKLLVNADLFDREVQIPIQGLYAMPLDQVSLDLPKAMLRYMQSLNEQAKKIEINPVASALKETLNDPQNHIKEIQKKNWLNKNILTYRNKKEKNVRAGIINGFYEREFEGQTLTGMGKDNNLLNKVVGALMGRASFAFFAMNIPSALKNRYGAMFQTMIESSAGRYLTPISYAQGRAEAAATAVEMSAQIYKRGPKTHRIQLMDAYDAIHGRFEQKVGESSSRSFLMDATTTSWLYSPRKWMEIEASLQMFTGMMYHQKVELKDGTEIPLIKAYETIDGQIRLKDDVADKEWGLDGEKFKQMKNKIHMVSNNLQGAYSKFDQPEAHRYLAYRMVSFLRRYFTPMIMNRWAFKGSIMNMQERYNIGLGEASMGYYMRSLKFLGRGLRSGGKELMYATPEEKQAMVKTGVEFAMLNAITMIILPLLFGYDQDDDDKYRKLREKQGEIFGEDFKYSGWLSNHALWLFMNIRAENEQFIPLPSYGLGDILQFKNVTSVVFGPTLDGYGKLVVDGAQWVAGDDRRLYQQDVGPYSWQKKGSAKAWNHFYKLFGITGTTTDPSMAVKNFNAVRMRFR